MAAQKLFPTARCYALRVPPFLGERTHLGASEPCCGATQRDLVLDASGLASLASKTHAAKMAAFTFLTRIGEGAKAPR